METDRSRIIAYQRCPRERFLAYHVGGTGLQRTRKSLPLQFGSAFHEGTERLLNMTDGFTSQEHLENAVGAAQNFLKSEFASHQVSFDGELPLDVEMTMNYGREEQMALAEALLRAWYSYEGESFLENFDVLEVEKEGRAQLSDDLTLMFRPDALVRDKQSGDCFVISWKTAATFAKRNIDQARHDQQSISEVWGLTQERGIKIEGVLYRWIIKGRRSLDKWDGLYKQNTHLIYGWVKLDTLNTEFPEWAWSYESEDDKGKTKRLGTGWQKRPIWRDYPGGIKAWIDDLAHSRVFPRHMDALQSVFPQALPVERRQDEVERWKRQIVAQETKIPMMLEAIESAPTEEIREELLDVHFPQYTDSCHKFSGCPMLGICWESVKAEPGELYQIRLANHPEKGDSDE